MIRFAVPELESALVNVCNTDGVYHAKIYSQYQTYGTQSGIVDFWLIFSGGKPIGAISGSGGRFTLAAERCEDVSELAAFLCAAGAKTVQAERHLLDGLGRLQESGLILRADTAPKQDAGVKSADSLADVWELLCASFEGFAEKIRYDAWYAEFSHKLRHDLAECYTLSVDGRLASASSILFKNTKCAVLAAVATHPDFRGQGLGKRTVTQATASAFAQGLNPVVLIREPGLTAFYAGCGYHPVGEWGQAEVQPLEN